MCRRRLCRRLKSQIIDHSSSLLGKEQIDTVYNFITICLPSLLLLCYLLPPPSNLNRWRCGAIMECFQSSALWNTMSSSHNTLCRTSDFGLSVCRCWSVGRSGWLARIFSVSHHLGPLFASHPIPVNLP